MRTQSELIQTEFPRGGPIHMFSRVVDYLFGLLYTLLVVRLVLELINAARNSGFFAFIRGITDPFLTPFRGIVASTLVDGHPIAWPIVIAIVVYMIVHAVIRGFLHLLVRA